MVTYTYNINSYNSNIQNVMNRIREELSTNPTIERDIEVTIDKGTYSGFSIPDASLYPLLNTTYRLIIKGAAGALPIIDFNYSNEQQVVGIDIGAGNPNVTIQGLRVQYFAVGIRATLNSHYPLVHNCIVNNNRNVGIFLEQCKEAQAVQNIVINGDYGIVSRLCKSSAIVHNTIFMNGAISTQVGTSNACVWAELANDYGGGVNDTGLLHLIGNIGWNTTGRVLTLFISDVEANRVISNYNDWVKSTDDFIALEDNAFYKGPESRPRIVYKNLNEWKQAGLDLNSKSEDPKFISPVKIRKDRNGYALDLNILPISPVLGTVPSFAYDSTYVSTYLPSYFDTNLLLKDILNQNRNQSNTAIGANDKPSSSGFFGQDVFSNPLELGLSKTCNLSPFSDVLFKSLELWYPKFKRGYFYSNEREYYLYSKKQTKNIGEIAETTFSLPGKIALNKEVKIKVRGKLIDSSYYDIYATNVILYHKDLDIITGEEEIEIEGWISNWNNNSFIYNKVLYRLKIKEGNTVYRLPSEYVPIGPVVITDDLAFFSDNDVISNREYSVYFNEGSMVSFSNDSNKLLNGQFDYMEEDYSPKYWISSGSTCAPASLTVNSVAGQYVCEIEDKGYLKNVLSLNKQGPSVFSFHTMSYGSGVLNWDIEFYDHNYDPIGKTVTGEIELKNIWHRYSIGFNSDLSKDIVIPQLPYPCTNIKNIELPEQASSFSIRLSHTDNPGYTGNLLIDAVQFEYLDTPSLYHRKHLFNELTIEYETSKEDYFIDSRLSMSPITNLMSDGFIFIPEIPAKTYGGPEDLSITTLHEWRWPAGRKQVMPWSRTKGKDKLRKRVKDRYHLLPQPKPEIISPVNYCSSIKEIELIPSIPTTFSDDIEGVGFTIKITDFDSNPSALTKVNAYLIDYNGKYAGLLHKKKYGLKYQLGPSIYDLTDSSGNLSLYWIPPKDVGIYRGRIPSPTLVSSTGDDISVINTEYPINLEALGNITIFDSTGTTLNLFSNNIIKNKYIPVYSEDRSNIKLKYPIKPGSVKLSIEGVTYLENQINILNSNEFFVDYENSTVSVKGRVTNIDVEYIPSYIYISQVDPYKIMIYHNKVFKTNTGLITVGYDFTVKLNVTAYDYSRGTTINQEFDMVVQNQLSSKYNSINTVSLEF